MLQPKYQEAQPCQVSSLPQSETISFISSTPTSPRTEDKDMLLSMSLVKNTQLNHGELVEPSQESQESLDPVLQEPVRLPLVTCAERPECLLHSKSGENGTEELILLKEDMPLPQLLQLLQLLLLLWLEFIMLTMSQNSH